MDNSKVAEFEIERGNLAEKTMTSREIKDIFVKLGVLEQKSSGGLRTLKFSDHVSILDGEDFDNALQGVSESVIDKLYEAYEEMQYGSYDALYAPTDFSAEEKANGHDGQYNKNAGAVIREQVSPAEIVSALIYYREAKQSALSNEAGNLERE